HSTIDGALALLATGRIKTNAIKSVRIGVGHAMFHHAGWALERPAETIGAQMNLAYAAAVALIDGAAFVEQFSPERLAADDVWDLVGRTTVVWDTEIDARGEEARWTSRLQVELI